MTTHEAENEAEANNYEADKEAEAVKFGLEADPASRTEDPGVLDYWITYEIFPGEFRRTFSLDTFRWTFLWTFPRRSLEFYWLLYVCYTIASAVTYFV